MKLTKIVSTSALSLLLTTNALMCAQEQREETKPAPAEEARPEAAKPAPDEMKVPRQDETKPRKDDAAPVKQEEKPNEDKMRSEDNKKEPKQEERDAKSAPQGRPAADRAASRIPDDKFRAHFGRQHTFSVQRTTTVGGQPRFQYGGYSFTIVDAWPLGWAYTDECYIDYIDGEYFLFDVLHPGVRVAVIVVS